MNLEHQKDTQTPHLIQQHIPLADKNWFRTGGTARFYARPATSDEFAQALRFAHSQGLSTFTLGEGANILISDEGFDGLVIHPHLTTITHAVHPDGSASVTVGSGATMPDLISYCLAHNLSGLEEFSGIPGTVGGSVYINLHYFEFLLEHFLTNATIIDRTTHQVVNVDKDWFNFGYNYSTLHKKEHYLVAATFKVKNVSDLETAYAQGRRREIIRHRAQRYPATHTCGSFFRNFYADEVTLESNGKKMIFVAYYLDKVGVKGILNVGDALVSYQHANMLVNRGKATSHDLISLARLMQQKVYDAFGILPQPECQLIGFKDYPLL